MSSASDVCLQFLGKKISVALDFIQFPRYFPILDSFWCFNQTSSTSFQSVHSLLLHSINLRHTKTPIYSIHMLTLRIWILCLSSSLKRYLFFPNLNCLRFTLYFGKPQEKYENKKLR